MNVNILLSLTKMWSNKKAVWRFLDEKYAISYLETSQQLGLTLKKGPA